MSKHEVERMTAENARTAWSAVTYPNPSFAARTAYEDEARLATFRELVYRVRINAGLTQRELAEKMGTTQSAIARMEGGAAMPTLQTLEKLATAVDAELVVGIGQNLSATRAIVNLVRDGRALIRPAI